MENLKQELQDLIVKFGNIGSVLRSMRSNLELQIHLKELTSFLPDSASISQRIWHVMSNVTSINKCIFCGNNTNFRIFSEGYSEYCSRKCASLGTVERRKEIFLARYGVENPAKSAEVQEKTKQTCLERYGVENPRQSQDVIEKTKITCLERYGVKSYSQTSEYKEKFKQTSLERYGVENPNQATSVRAKYVNTCKDKYDITNTFQLTKQEDREQSCIEKYGVKNPFQIPEVQEQVRQTNLERYGFENVASSPEIQEKISRSVRDYCQDHDNPFLGKHHTEESIQKMKEAKIKWKENGGRIVRTEEYCSLLSTALIKYHASRSVEEKKKQAMIMTNARKEQNTIPWAKGLTKETDERILRISQKQLRKIISEETHKKQSIAAIKRIIQHGPSYVHRHYCKGHFYSEKSNSKLRYDSSYELVAFKSLEQRVDIQSYDRCKFYIEYLLDEKIHRYSPDFHVVYENGIQEIIEVKPSDLVYWKINQIKIQAGEKYCKQRSWNFTVWTEKELGIK
jgi:hypothetical protein